MVAVETAAVTAAVDAAVDTAGVDDAAERDLFGVGRDPEAAPVLLFPRVLFLRDSTNVQSVSYLMHREQRDSSELASDLPGKMHRTYCRRSSSVVLVLGNLSSATGYISDHHDEQGTVSALTFAVRQGTQERELRGELRVRLSVDIVACERLGGEQCLKTIVGTG